MMEDNTRVDGWMTKCTEKDSSFGQEPNAIRGLTAEEVKGEVEDKDDLAKRTFGRIVFEDGSLYEGNLLNGREDGRGQKIDRRGKVVDGNWQGGVIVNTI